MLLAYVDESYTQARYWIGAVVCPEGAVQRLIESLDAVVEKAATSYRGISSTAELHGHALFHGKDDWELLQTMPRARVGIYADALRAIGAADVQVLIRGVHVPRLNKRYGSWADHPHSVVLEHLIERLDELAHGDGENLLVIADQVSEADRYRQHLWHFQRYSTSGYKPRQIRRVVDTIYFAPSTSSRLVQAADLIVYLHQRITSEIERDDRARRANASLWEEIAPKVVHQHCWWP